MPKAFIGLGSNLGRTCNGVFESSKIQLHTALDSIAQHPKIKLLKCSSFYRTKAVGPGEQPDYINGAAMLETSLSAYELLDFLQQIEQQQGRQRTIRWGARTIDLDILLYGNLVESTERLCIPHPQLHKRAFVLAPLADLDPELAIPNRKNVGQLLANCSMQGIVKLTE
jgi:2-amino-4-hydroxy-6-hydroxymethyldihydropteridine diphosphokinase